MVHIRWRIPALAQRLSPLTRHNHRTTASYWQPATGGPQLVTAPETLLELGDMTIREAAPAVSEDEEPAVPPRAARRFPLPTIILALLLIIGALFRFDNLNWDDGKLLHPDELHITDVISNRIHAPDLRLLLNSDRSTLNPRSVDPAAYEPDSNAAKRPRQFAYGSLPLFATDFAAWVWGLITHENWNVFWEIFRVGRVMTGLCDL